MFTLKHPSIDLGIVCSNFNEAYHFYHDLLGVEVVLDIQISQDLATKADLAPPQIPASEAECQKYAAEADGNRFASRKANTRLPDRSPLADLHHRKRPQHGRVTQHPGVEFLSGSLSAPDAKHVVSAKGPDGMPIEFEQLPD